MTPKERLINALRAKRQNKPLVDWLFQRHDQEDQEDEEDQEELPPPIPAVELLAKMEKLGSLHAELDQYLAQRGPQTRIVDNIEARLRMRIGVLQAEIDQNREATLDWGNLNMGQLRNAARRFNIDITALEEGNW